MVEELSLAHGLARYAHILLFVYWLGGDAGVFYSASFVTNPKLTRDQRLTAFKIFVNLGCVNNCAEQLSSLSDERSKGAEAGSRYRTALGRTLNGQAASEAFS